MMHTKKRFGFTLIEILMVMVLIGLTVGGGVVGFNRTTINRQIEATTEQVRKAFAQAKASAVGGKKDCSVCGTSADCAGAAPLDGWEVVLVANSVTVRGVCGAQQFLSTTQSLPVNISINGPATIRFLPRTGGIQGSQGSCVVTTVGGMFTDRGVRVSTAGLIESTNSCP